MMMTTTTIANRINVKFSCKNVFCRKGCQKFVYYCYYLLPFCLSHFFDFKLSMFFVFLNCLAKNSFIQMFAFATFEKCLKYVLSRLKIDTIKVEKFGNSKKEISIFLVKIWKMFEALTRFFKWANPGLFFYFRSFQTNNTIFITHQWKNVHPVYGTGIQTHNLSNMRCHP